MSKWTGLSLIFILGCSAGTVKDEGRSQAVEPQQVSVESEAKNTEKDSRSDVEGAPKPEQEKTTSTLVEPAPAQPTTIRGRVTLTSTPPTMPSLRQRMADCCPGCSAVHEGQPEPKLERVVAGSNGELANAIVYVSAGIEEKFSIPREAAKMSLKGCMYAPHVLAVRVGQVIEVKNEDDSLHNVHTTPPKKNAETNHAILGGGPALNLRLRAPEFVPVRCDVHPWMTAWIGAFNHPYFSVTTTDGTFEFSEKLAPGKYVVSVWHEAYGETSQEMEISGGTRELEFVYEGEPQQPTK
ncbi:MAG: hypothetical protein AAF517_26680 [Planctomycetota bacterium]